MFINKKARHIVKTGTPSFYPIAKHDTVKTEEPTEVLVDNNEDETTVIKDEEVIENEIVVKNRRKSKKVNNIDEKALEDEQLFERE